MPDATFPEITLALADQIQSVLGTAVPGIQVEGELVLNPTPVCVDIYPADPFMEQTAFSLISVQVAFTVRARVNTADNQSAQSLLLAMMDPRAPESVAVAIESDRDLGGKVSQVRAGPPTGFQVFTDAGGNGSLLGCQWTATVIV